MENPRAYFQAERRKRRWQWSQARRTPASRNWHDAQRRIDQSHRRINGLRDNDQHQLLSRLTRECGAIGVESLRAKGVAAEPAFGQGPVSYFHIATAGPYSLQGQVVRARELVAADIFFLPAGPVTPAVQCAGNWNSERSGPVPHAGWSTIRTSTQLAIC